ncbi:MAG: cold-shock protein [Gallionella sp.]
MQTGIVKWFDDSTSLGYVTPDDGSDDLLAHFSPVNMNGFKFIKKGLRISFEVTQSPQAGRQVSNINITTSQAVFEDPIHP